jgi:hypothetical protein
MKLQTMSSIQLGCSPCFFHHSRYFCAHIPRFLAV